MAPEAARLADRCQPLALPVRRDHILACRRGVLAIIEVKLRRDLETAAAAILPRQRRRIARAASAFLMTRPDLARLTLRFDVMLVAPLRPPRHLAGMWRSDE